jgi:protein-S-isoprenylcysteine O-methyltransferase Ste14
MVARIFDWFQLAALACWLVIGLWRMLALYARGVPVLAPDRDRAPAQLLCDLLAGACLVVWWYELVAYAAPLQFHVIPKSLDVVLLDAMAFKTMGLLAWLAALSIYGLALWAIGDSWRIGIDRGAPGSLVTDGIFAWSRNPIYFSFTLGVMGTFLIQGRLIFLVIALVLAGLLRALIRREERFLAHTYGDAYREYEAKVGRYVTWPRFHRGRHKIEA